MADENEYWWSIEVLDAAERPAGRWRDAYAASLIEAAISHGAKDWNWNRFDWGVVFEVAFADYAAWSIFRQLPAVVAALDAVPDPINGLLIYPGRGGSAAAGLPRKPGPRTGAGAAPIPTTPERDKVATVDLVVDRWLTRDELVVPSWHPEAAPGGPRRAA